MSFLDSVLSSIQTGKPSQLPVSQPPTPPATSYASKKDDRKPTLASRVPPSNGTTNGGTKRKAEDQLPRPSKPENKLASKATVSSAAAPTRHANNGSKPAMATISKPASPKPVSKNGAAASTKAGPTKVAPPKPAAAPAKPPPKGSYADLMLQAKAMQDKAPADLGQFRHRPIPKEKTSRVERKRREKEAIARAKAERAGKKYVPPANGRTAVKRPSPEMPSYKGTAKPTQTPELPAYRGTAGLPTSRGANDRRSQAKRRANEYLGTDEEDEGDYGDYDDYYSDASSDMEAGFDDVADEEGVALKAAQKEDEKELRLEMAAKKEKMERQRKLAALASRKR